MNSGVHITILLCILLLGTAGNCTIIRVYFKRNPHDKVYSLVVLLAVLDLVACNFPFLFGGLLKTYIKDDATTGWIQFIHSMSVRFFILSNVSILAAMAVDRALAVFRPYQYKTFQPKIHRPAIALIVIWAVETLMASLFYEQYANPISRIVFVGSVLSIGLIISTIYLLIICKLYRERNAKVESAPGAGSWRTTASRHMYGQRFVQV